MKEIKTTIKNRIKNININLILAYICIILYLIQGREPFITIAMACLIFDKLNNL